MLLLTTDISFLELIGFLEFIRLVAESLHLWWKSPGRSTLCRYEFCCFCLFVSQIARISEIMWCLSFCVWLILLSLMFYRFIHVVASGRISFCFKAEKNVPQYYVYTTFLYQFLGWWTYVVSVPWLLWIMLHWTLECRYLHKAVILFPSDVYPEVGLLGYMIALFLIFWGTFILFSTVAASVYIPTNRAQEFRFLRILTNTFYLLT